MGVTEVLSKFVAESSYDDLPREAISAAKRGLLDYIAVTAAGSKEAAAEKLKMFVVENAGKPEATVINGGLKTSASLAALLNGTMSHALDYDDVIHVLPFWLGHPSVAILPAVFAIADKKALSGRDVIYGYSLGIEIYVKTALICGDGPYKNGWHNTSYVGSMAAAGACAGLLGLDEKKTANAFGIAASMACGTRQNFGTMTKPLHAGLAARNGVEAALLAASGFTANETIYEGKLGFRNLFTASVTDMSEEMPFGNEVIRIEDFAKKLGNPWNIASPGTSAKLCPSCRATHFGMEAGMEYREIYKDGPDAIEEIVCRMPDHTESVLRYHLPQKGLEGKFSMEYVLARAVMDGLPGIHDFTDERVSEDEIRSLIAKMRWISFVPPEGAFGIPEFTFKRKDGTEKTFAIEFAKGEPENPVTDEVMVKKYWDCTEGIFSEETKGSIKDLVLGLEGVEEISILTNLIGKVE